jgi:endonuclease/exonuclease/phosphatase family metal-dependent hydrolase
MVIMIFMNIFSNVWGYVEPVSPFFRNKFWLPFLLILAMVTIITFLASRRLDTGEIFGATNQGFTWPAVILGLVFMATLVAALMTDRSFVEPLPGNSLKVMTYNIQQAINEMGEKSYLDQLALIEQVDPDLIAFQESDSTRISLGNNDYIRYYANQLGYHSYFGPTTVTGTYGTAILSKYPLENTRAVFTFSDQDEIGTAEAEITVGGTTFSIFNVHPDGSDEAKMVFANTLVDRASQQEHVIALGDYNLRGWEQAYLVVDAHYKNAWMDAYPSGVDDQGLDMSGRERIDHIFVSPHLQVADPVYKLPPTSWTDHPVHWTDISWE